jgi:hypothetical protein
MWKAILFLLLKLHHDRRSIGECADGNVTAFPEAFRYSIAHHGQSWTHSASKVCIEVSWAS